MTKRIVAAALGFALIFGLVACSEGGRSSTPEEATSSVDTGGSGELPQGDDPVDLDPADFTAEIDNPYWPMLPGTRWTYREIDEEGNKVKVVAIVTAGDEEACRWHHRAGRT